MNMNHEAVTLLETRDKEIIEIPYPFETWLNAKSNAKSKWEDWIYLEKEQRYLKFSNIKDEKWKTKYLSLNQPTQYKEPTQEERETKAKFLKEIYEKTYDSRKKKFIEKRKEILSDLAKKEIEYWLETTESKLTEFNLLKLNNVKNKNI